MALLHRQNNDLIYILSEKINKITTSASVNVIGGTIDPDNLTDSDSDGIDGGTGCNSLKNVI